MRHFRDRAHVLSAAPFGYRYVRKTDHAGACASSTRDINRGLAGVAHVDFYLQSLGGEICLILPPGERTCRRLSQDVASRETLRNRKVSNTESAR